MPYSEPPYFPLYVRDFYSSGKVAAMSPTAVGAYILLLCQAWGEKPPASVPNDDTVLAAWARMDPVTWTEHKSVVLAAFRLGKDNRWHQPRLRDEFNKFKKLSQQRSKSGKIGGKNHWRKVREDKELNSTAITPLIANDSIAVAVSVKDLKSVCDTRATYPPYHSQSGQDLHCDALAILHEVNERCGKHFPDHYAAGLAVIKDRLIEGRTHDEFSRIIEVKLHDPLFQQKPNLYDPRTLFSADKFDVYLHQDPEGWNSNKGMPTPKSEKAKSSPYICDRCHQGLFNCECGDAMICPDCGEHVKMCKCDRERRTA
jgi:uncharacterized phage protein (TIGR02220 family)